MEQRKYTGLDASLCTQWTKERHQGAYFPPKLLLKVNHATWSAGTRISAVVFKH